MTLFILKTAIIIGVALIGGLLVSLIERYEHEQSEQDQQTLKGEPNDEG